MTAAVGQNPNAGQAHFDLPANAIERRRRGVQFLDEILNSCPGNDPKAHVEPFTARMHPRPGGRVWAAIVRGPGQQAVAQSSRNTTIGLQSDVGRAEAIGGKWGANAR